VRERSNGRLSLRKLRHDSNRAEYRALFEDMLAAERIAGKMLDVYKRIDPSRFVKVFVARVRPRPRLWATLAFAFDALETGHAQSHSHIATIAPHIMAHTAAARLHMP
jgi:hypothetical protein